VTLAASRPARGVRLAIALILALVVVMVASRAATSLYVDVLWYRQLGYLPIFVRELTWVWGLRLGVMAAVTLVLFLNLRVVAGSVGTLQIKRRFGNLEIAERLPSRYILGGILLFSLLLGAWLAASIPAHVGRSALFQAAAAPWGDRDPFLGLDLSFYAFTLPLLRTGVTFALVVVFLAFTVVAAGYATTGTLRFGEGGVIMTEGARRHLGILMAAFLALLATRLLVSMPLLLMFGSSDVQEIFGYADHRARMRTLPLQALVTLAGAAAVLFGTWRNRLVPVVAGIGISALAVIGLGQLYPSFVQRFRVVPNELAREAPYIEASLEHTRLGFGLDDLEQVRYEARAAEDIDWADARAQLRGLPVWTTETLSATFREVEARYRYYEFGGITMDRYRGPGGEPIPVALSVREIDPAGIEEPNWQNLHLRERYVAGNGAVAVAAAGRTSEGRAQMFLAGIPPEFDQQTAPPALDLRRASIFVGSRPQPPYALVGASDSAYLAPDGTPGRPGVDFPDGIAVSGTLRKALLAWYLREANLLFSSEVRAESRLVLRRGAVERARAIAPFLRFPEAPYPVITEGRVVWILEGFTATRYFPLSRAFELELRTPVSYTRNSVKVTVDAVTGDVAFYSLPVDDPLRDTYGRAFPGLLRPLEEMPAELREHLRYSRTLHALQSEVLLAYHQETAATFFGQQDLWATPQELTASTEAEPYRAEYALMRMPGDTAEDFRLVTSFVPAGRQNLTALAAGEIRPDGTYRLRLFHVPVENQVPGPRQVEALVEQDPLISQQFSLWRSGGSRVWTGHLHLVPVGDRMLYMEPVFLAADTDAIPELRRFVLSDGRRVTLQPTLEEAIAVLSGEPAPDPTSGETDAPDEGLAAGLSSEALELLDRAEASLRAGDWAGFGDALERLRTLLRAGAGGGGE
jgi:hypothetical protein